MEQISGGEYSMVPNIIKEIPGYSYFRDVLKYAIKRAQGNIDAPLTLDRFEFVKLATFFNKYPDKTFYIIRNQPKNLQNLCAYFYSVLDHIIYADVCGYIPVVDMENYLTAYSEKKPIHGTWNSWEYYFKQPSPYALEDAYSAKNIILSPFDKQFATYPYGISFINKSFIALRNYYIERYISFAPWVLEAVAEKSILFNGKRNILGVMHHNSFKKAMFHPVVPDLSSLLQKAIEAYKEWNMEYVFLSTIDAGVIDPFKDAFGDKLLLLERERINPHLISEEDRVNSDHQNAPLQRSRYTSGLEYLIDMIMLSKCDSYVGPLSLGSRLVMDLNNNQFLNHFVFDLGIVQPDENNALISGTKFFIPYPPSFDKVVNRIFPPSPYPVGYFDYMQSLTTKVIKWVNNHKTLESYNLKEP
jgi:hypothetical protein